MKSGIRLAALAAIAATLSACGASHMVVMEPNRSAVKAEGVQLVYDDSVMGVPQEAVDKVKRYMQDRFFGEGAAFTRGNEMTVRYGFVGFDEGSQFSRWFFGGLGDGKATMVIQAEFVDQNGNVLAKVQSEGELSAGFFGGDSDSAIKKAVGEIGDYAETNFQ